MHVGSAHTRQPFLKEGLDPKNFYKGRQILAALIGHWRTDFERRQPRKLGESPRGGWSCAMRNSGSWRSQLHGNLRRLSDGL
jgi:hypothetical protein